MRTTSLFLLPLFAAACAEETPSPGADALAREKSDGAFTLGTTIDLVCLDESCKQLAATLVPAAKASWWLDGRHVGDGFELELDAAELVDHLLEADTGDEAVQAWVSSIPSGVGHDPNTVALGIASGGGCDRFWIQAVGGCIVSPIDVKVLADTNNLARFSRPSANVAWGAPTLSQPAWGAWWPAGYTPSNQLALAGRQGLGVVFGLGATPVRLAITHDNGAQSLIGFGVCENGQGYIWGPGAQ